MKFFRTSGASHTRRREGPHQFTQNRSWTFVTVLQRLSAAETTKNRPSRDFRGLSIFDFFNTIEPKADIRRLVHFDLSQALAASQTQHPAGGSAMARHDWVFAISLAGILISAIGAIWIVLFGM